MKLRNRFLLVSFGIIVFTLTTPVIVLYALGYKLDVKTGQVTKTGSLVTRSEPNRSQIYINDVLQSTKTGNTLRFLLPGDYNFKIAREGYQSWTKRLNIRPGLATWANQDREFITLFFNTPKFESEQKLLWASVSVEENTAVIVKDDGTFTYNPDRLNFDQVNEGIPVTSPAIEIPNKESVYYYNRDAAARTFSAQQLNTSKQLESNGKYAVLLAGLDLFLSRDGAVTLFATNVSGFHLEDEHLWYIEGNLLKHATINMGAIEQITTLPYSPVNSQIIRGNSQIFLILDHTAYALNDKLEEVYRGADTAYWDSSAGRLVISNNNEALLFDPGSFRSELIIRSSSAIHQPLVNQHTGYLFFINEDKLKAIELDGRDHRNVYTISTEPVKSYLLSDEGDYLTIFTDTELKTYQIR
jgi:PEGA domain